LASASRDDDGDDGDDGDDDDDDAMVTNMSVDRRECLSTFTDAGAVGTRGRGGRGASAEADMAAVGRRRGVWSG
jgi:hypothetical protein